MNNTTQVMPFSFKDCALSAIATGRRAQTLRELRDHIQQVQPDSIYYHFWGGRLQPQFDEPEYNNDFAGWVRHALRDHSTAEQLAVIDPTEFESLEDLRAEIIEVIEARLYEQEMVPWSKPDEKFSFIRSQIVVFDRHHSLEDPARLGDEIPHTTTSSIFYHFIDARRRSPKGRDDFSNWLEGFGDRYVGLIERLADVDPYFSTLSELRNQLTDVIEHYFHETESKGGM
ncbi:MAG: hypothetical protein KFH87_02135 [Bacteroidetes bacterium]|nr:hypothetical protein [Bacteroidota bacterium]